MKSKKDIINTLSKVIRYQEGVGFSRDVTRDIEGLDDLLTTLEKENTTDKEAFLKREFFLSDLLVKQRGVSGATDLEKKILRAFDYGVNEPDPSGSSSQCK